jgi:nucleoside-diphosphate-sugar epimerase
MTNPRQILVTGANGFVGQALCKTLRLKGYPVRAAVRTSATDTKADFAIRTETVVVGSITAGTDWTSRLTGVEVVVHLAARTHIIHENAGGVLVRYRQVNVEATERLASMAAASGVKRFVFMSSVKVNGERTFDHSFTEIDMPQPGDAYGISKWEAEQALARIAKETGLEFVVVRSPLVYGPGVKGNFLHLMRLIARGTPLPLASVANRRSLIYVGNLVDAITACIEAPAAASKTYLVSDGEDVSTPDLIRAMAAALGVPARLFPFPAALLRLGAGMLGKSAEIARLIGSLQVDSTRIQNELGWRPRSTLTEGIEQTARWYRRLTGDE